MAPEDAASAVRLPLLDGLNDEQLAAVTLPSEHALIVAGAGSGKTRVLITRIAWLLQTGQVSPGGILAVTFTNKAAKEMFARLSAMLPLNVRGMWIGTFHGLCHRLLRAHYQMAGLPQSFQILDTQDQLSAIKRLVKQHGIDEERFVPRQLQWYIAGCKEEGLRPADVDVRDADSRRKAEIYQLYENQCQREAVVDFGELMLRSYELLRDHEVLRLHYRRRFRYLLIDEFQDTNRLQYDWIKIIAGLPTEGAQQGSDGGAIMAVGDDDQSIYAFRGACVGNMADFVRDFHVQHQIKLEQNYRSYGNILDSANALIAHNQKRLGKNLRTVRGAGEPVHVVESVSDFAEAKWVVDELRQLNRNKDIALDQIAILYRSNAQSRVLETQLFNAGVPYRVYGGLRFFERAEIKHALAYLRLLENPKDDTSFLRVVNFPPRGIGACSIKKLQYAARAEGLALVDAVASVPGRVGTHLAAFVTMIDVLREQTEGKTLREIIELTLDASGLIEHYRNEREGAERIENLEELTSAAESFVTQEGFECDAVALPVDETRPLSQSPVSQGLDPSAPQPTKTLSSAAMRTAIDVVTGETLSPLAAFLTHAALEAGDNQAQAGQLAVQLMTIHASKGLEFDAVFITGMEESLFPHENALTDLGGLEEERRLMYVAITRARKRLYLSYAQTRMLHGQTRHHMRSRFLDELPQGFLRWITFRGAVSGSFASSQYRSQVKPTWGRSTLQDDSLPVAQALRDTASNIALRVGHKVFHNKYGEGTVRTIEGKGDDARAQIEFSRHGMKWMALAVAKLTLIN